MSKTVASALQKRKTVTENGMVTNVSSRNACVDLFYVAGAMRGKDITSKFAAAYDENPEYAIRLAQWIRDCREGLGEKEHYRNILRYMANNNLAINVNIIPEMGYYKDLLMFLEKDAVFNEEIKAQVLELIQAELYKSNGLCAKWMPRKGYVANKIRNFLGLTHKEYRQTLVNLTNVVETKMCNQEWDDIDYKTVPSVAHNIYKKAFGRHSDKYATYIASVLKGETKINSSVLYPYQIIQEIMMRGGRNIDKAVMKAQWDALPNWMGEENILPLVDVSGSMSINVHNNTSAMVVAISMGLYCADKNKGKFKDILMNFSHKSEIYKLTGDIISKVDFIHRMPWGGNTNLEKAFKNLLQFGIQHKIPNKEMPTSIVIFSDMEFDQCVTHPNAGAYKMIKDQYKNAGYSMPKIIFWNIASRHDNVPVKYNKEGAALVSGFSPNMLRTIFDVDNFTPEKIMLETIMKDRYDITKY